MKKIPRAKLSELPENIKRLIPSVEGRELFLKVYNSAMNEFNDPAKAAENAWKALKRAGYKEGPDGRWRNDWGSFKTPKSHRPKGNFNEFSSPASSQT